MRNRWRIIEKFEKRDIDNAQYMAAMVQEKRKLHESIKKDGQCLSTEKLQKVSDGEAAARRKQLEDPYFWLSLKDRAKADFISERDAFARYDMDQISHIEALRRRPKNALGESKLSSASGDRKHKAIESFMHTPPAPLDPLKDINEIKVIVTILRDKIRNKEELLPAAKKNWLFFKRKFRAAPTPDRMSYAELQEYWKSLEREK